MTKEHRDIIAFMANPMWKQLKEDVAERIRLCDVVLHDWKTTEQQIRFVQGEISGLNFLTDHFEFGMIERINELKTQGDENNG